MNNIFDVGDIVCWKYSPDIIGTIKKIYTTSYPFYVVWNNGKDDWYKSDSLQKLVHDETKTQARQK